MFVAQCTGTALGSCVNYILIRSVIATKRDLLDGTTPDPTGQWTGRKPAIFYSASVICAPIFGSSGPQAADPGGQGD